MNTDATNTEQLVRTALFVSITRMRADFVPIDEFGNAPDYFHVADRRYRLHTKPNSPVAIYSLIDPTSSATLGAPLVELVAVADGLPNVSGEIDAQREKMQEAIDALLVANERQAVENHSLRQRAEEADKLREDRRERASRAVQNAINREQQAAEKVERAQTELIQYKEHHRLIVDLNTALNHRVGQIIEQAGKWKQRALAAEHQAEQDHAEWQTMAADLARLADVERNLQDAQADLHDARAELQAARKNALEVISNLAQQLPGPILDAEIVNYDGPVLEVVASDIGGLDAAVRAYLSPSGIPVVQIDTSSSGRIRVNLNDGVIWDGNPESDERPGKHAAPLPHEIPAADPAYTPEEREKIDDWNDHLASAHEQLSLQRLANGTLGEELDQLRAENNGLRADLRVNRAQGVTKQAEEIEQLRAQLAQTKRDREETARIADDEIHKQAEHFRAVIQQHVDSAITAGQTVANQRETLEQLRAQLEEIHSGLRDQIQAARMDVWRQVRKAAGLKPDDTRDALRVIREHAAPYGGTPLPLSEIIDEANAAIKQLRLELTERLTEIQNLQSDLHIAREHAKNVVAQAARDAKVHSDKIQGLMRDLVPTPVPAKDVQRETGLPAESPYFPQEFTPGA